MRSLAIIVFTMSLFSLGMPISVLAADAGINVAPTGLTGDAGINIPPSSSSNGSNVTLMNPLKSGTNLQNFLTNILQFVINIGSVVVVLMVVFVGYKFVVAQGNESKITEAKDMLLWTVVGALVLLGAQAIALGIKATVQALGG